jgi:flagellar biosynthesis/type III secretory pathway M-ring protein FliF/YscJ
MNDPVPMSTRTIWLAAAVVFGLAFLVSVFKGSILFAVLLLLIVGGCVYQSRRAPANDADVDERKAQAEQDDHEGDEREGDDDEKRNEDEDDEPDQDEKRDGE